MWCDINQHDGNNVNEILLILFDDVKYTYLMHYIGNIYHLVLFIKFMLQILIKRIDTQYKCIYLDNHTIKPESVFMP